MNMPRWLWRVACTPHALLGAAAPLEGPPYPPPPPLRCLYCGQDIFPDEPVYEAYGVVTHLDCHEGSLIDR
jgi:hypothetical protein